MLARKGISLSGNGGLKRTRLRPPVAVMLLAVLLATPAVVRGLTVELPDSSAIPPQRPMHGLKLTLETFDRAYSGYLPIRLSFERTASSSVDTLISIRLSNRAGDFSERSCTAVYHDIMLPAGAAQAETTISYPHVASGYAFSLDIFVDGSLARELSGQFPLAWEEQPSQMPRFLLVEDGAAAATAYDLIRSFYPNISDADASALQLQHATSGGQYFPNIGYVANSLMRLAADKFPTRPRDYSSFDIVYLTVAQLKSLKAQPEVWNALRGWVASGGNVWVVGAGAQWEHLGEIEDAFRFARKPGDPQQRGWTTYSAAERQNLEQALVSNTAQLEAQLNRTAEQTADAERHNLLYVHDPSGGAPRPRFPERPPAEGDPPEPDPSDAIAAVLVHLVPPQIPQLLWQEYLLGQVRVFAEEHPFGALGSDGRPLPARRAGQATAAQRFPIQALLLHEREWWEPRHGLNCFQPTYYFWNWLIPGVGLAPVGWFQVLITLFVLAIGPLNFYIIRRLKRLYLLLVTVPVSAAVVTLVLFGYALLADGLGTKARIRSYTEIDARDGTTVSWARHTYYAGLAPDYLAFPLDTVVLPIHPDSQGNYRWRGIPERYREVEWNDRQLLKGEWLTSRTPTQLLAIGTTKSNARVNVDFAALQVENQLGATIVQLVAVDSNGNAFVAEQVPAGARQSLRAAALPLAAGALSQQVAARALEFPAAMGGVASYSSTYPAATPSYTVPHQPWQTNVGWPVYGSRLERSLERVRDGGQAGAANPYLPGRFVAIVDRSPWAATAVDGAVEDGSLHVVVGRWTSATSPAAGQGK